MSFKKLIHTPRRTSVAVCLSTVVLILASLASGFGGGEDFAIISDTAFSVGSLGGGGKDCAGSIYAADRLNRRLQKISQSADGFMNDVIAPLGADPHSGVPFGGLCNFDNNRVVFFDGLHLKKYNYLTQEIAQVSGTSADPLVYPYQGGQFAELSTLKFDNVFVTVNPISKNRVFLGQYSNDLQYCSLSTFEVGRTLTVGVVGSDCKPPVNNDTISWTMEWMNKPTAVEWPFNSEAEFYVVHSDSNQIRAHQTNGKSRRAACTGLAGDSVDGTATFQARCNAPIAIRRYDTGLVSFYYFSERNKLRKWDPTADTITTTIDMTTMLPKDLLGMTIPSVPISLVLYDQHTLLVFEEGAATLRQAYSFANPGTFPGPAGPPLTLAPTTETPSTETPTTKAPTTEVPTTQVPTTETPTTETPSTEVPTTETPSTKVPTTETPSTKVPTTEVPTTETPTTEVPTTEVPTTEVPTTETPTTEEPTTATPSTLVPTTATPTTSEPTEVPTTVSTTTEVPPTTEVPTTEVPTTVSAEPPTTTEIPSTQVETTTATPWSTVTTAAPTTTAAISVTTTTTEAPVPTTTVEVVSTTTTTAAAPTTTAVPTTTEVPTTAEPTTTEVPLTLVPLSTIVVPTPAPPAPPTADRYEGSLTFTDSIDTIESQRSELESRFLIGFGVADEDFNITGVEAGSTVVHFVVRYVSPVKQTSQGKPNATAEEGGGSNATNTTSTPPSFNMTVLQDIFSPIVESFSIRKIHEDASGWGLGLFFYCVMFLFWVSFAAVVGWFIHRRSNKNKKPMDHPTAKLKNGIVVVEVVSDPELESEHFDSDEDVEYKGVEGIQTGVVGLSEDVCNLSSSLEEGAHGSPTSLLRKNSSKKAFFSSLGSVQPSVIIRKHDARILRGEKPSKCRSQPFETGENPPTWPALPRGSWKHVLNSNSRRTSSSSLAGDSKEMSVPLASGGSTRRRSTNGSRRRSSSGSSVSSGSGAASRRSSSGSSSSSRSSSNSSNSSRSSTSSTPGPAMAAARTVAGSTLASHRTVRARKLTGRTAAGRTHNFPADDQTPIDVFDHLAELEAKQSRDEDFEQ